MSVRSWFTTAVAVTPYEGESSTGPTFGAEQTVLVRVNEGRKLVRDRNGDEVVSETTIYGPLAAADAFPPESLVTVNGRPTRVIAASPRQGLRGRGLDHVEVALA